MVLDLMLPGLDGFGVCRRLREHLPVPVIMLTARGEETDRLLGLGLGADDYVAKPPLPTRAGRPGAGRPAPGGQPGAPHPRAPRWYAGRW